MISIPTLYWHERGTHSLKFDKDWNVRLFHMNGYNFSRMNDEEILFRIANPIGSRTLEDLASEREEAVILFDDMTRPTQTSRIVMHVLNALRRGGISDDHVRFVNALGAHGASNRIDFVKKLGERIVERFPIYNHNPFGNLTEVGKTASGTPVKINSEVMSCDLKIGIGCIIPHSMTGFTGGGSIILPGVASIETICYNHCNVGGECFENISTTGWKPAEGNRARADIDEAARLVGLDFKIDVVVNEEGEISGVSAGDFSAQHAEGVKAAKEVYSTDFQDSYDVVVSNTYPRANQAVTGMNLAVQAVKEGGVIVLIVDSPEGQCTHYVYGKFGKKLGGTLWSSPPLYAKRFTLIVYSQNKEKDPALEICDPDLIKWTRTWNETLEAAESSINLKNPKVAVFPTAGIQVPASILKL